MILCFTFHTRRYRRGPIQKGAKAPEATCEPHVAVSLNLGNRRMNNRSLGQPERATISPGVFPGCDIWHLSTSPLIPSSICRPPIISRCGSVSQAPALTPVHQWQTGTSRLPAGQAAHVAYAMSDQHKHPHPHKNILVARFPITEVGPGKRGGLTIAQGRHARRNFP